MQKTSSTPIFPLWRALTWGGAALLLLLPAIAMQFTDEVKWGAGDFAIFGAMLVVAVLAVELVMKFAATLRTRILLGVAIALAFFLTWAQLAVGIFGS